MLETELKENLRTFGQAYMARRPYPATTLLALAAKDARFRERLDSGKTLRVKT
jgi:hypothetical protein